MGWGLREAICRILRHRGVQLILAYSLTRPATSETGKNFKTNQYETIIVLNQSGAEWILAVRDLKLDHIFGILTSGNVKHYSLLVHLGLVKRSKHSNRKPGVSSSGIFLCNSKTNVLMFVKPPGTINMRYNDDVTFAYQRSVVLTVIASFCTEKQTT